MSIVTVGKPLSYEEERGKPMPSRNHSAVQTNLISEFARQRDFRVHSELTLDISGKPVAPDLSVYGASMGAPPSIHGMTLPGAPTRP